MSKIEEEMKKAFSKISDLEKTMKRISSQNQAYR